MKRTSTQQKKPPSRGPIASDSSSSSSAIAQRSPSRRSFWIITSLGSFLILVVGIGLLANRWSVGSQIVELRRSCDQAVRASDWPSVERIARQWAVLEPNSVRPWTMAASASRAMGDLKGCADYLAQLPDAAPVEAFHELSLLQMEALVQPLAARQTCERTLRIYPGDNESSLRLMFIDTMLCQRDKVSGEAKRAIRAGADLRATYAYLFTANWITFSNGAKLNRFWLEKDPQNEVFQIAAVAHEIHDRDSSTPNAETTNADASSFNQHTQLYELLERYPHSIELRMIALSKHLQAGQVAEVGELLDVQSEDFLSDGRYWRFRGWYLAAQEQWPEATAAYQRALEIYPFDFSSQNELAGILRRIQGIEASQDMQAKANLGIELQLTFLGAANFEAVSQADYQRLADYLELCGETDFSNGLRKHLR